MQGRPQDRREPSPSPNSRPPLALDTEAGWERLVSAHTGGGDLGLCDACQGTEAGPAGSGVWGAGMRGIGSLARR